MARLTVALRGGFSDRNKIRPENASMQTEFFDERTRKALVNATNIIFNSKYDNFVYSSVNSVQSMLKHLMADVYGQLVDWSAHYDPKPILSSIYETICSDTYDAILTVIEYVVAVIDEGSDVSFIFEGEYYSAAKLYNQVFEKEYVGYRIVKGYATPITDPHEGAEIEDAAAIRHIEVGQHIEKALRYLSDREKPDYANSIKESISAVERMCSIIIGKPTTLGDALKKLEDSGVTIHPAMKSAFDKLYGYTSDASGIRHAGRLGGSDSTFEEAKFMLVSCCAFVNYLSTLLSKCSS